MDRVVAVKVLLSPGNPDAVVRVLREGRALAAIDSPRVVRIFDLDVVEGCPYLVIELLEGGSLRQRLARERPIPVAVASELAVAALEGLAACHAAVLRCHSSSGSSSSSVEDFEDERS